MKKSTHCMIKLFFIFSFYFIFANKYVNAQTDRSKTDTTNSICFRGQPRPYCRTFLIVEYGFFRTSSKFKPNSYETPRKPGYCPSWELGAMFNSDEKSAYGGTVIIRIPETVSDPFTGRKVAGTAVGLKARYRRWINRSISLDFGSGVVTGSETVSFTADMGLNLRDQVAIVLRIDNYAQQVNKRFHVYVGARFGSVPGLIVGTAMTILSPMIRHSIPSGDE